MESRGENTCPLTRAHARLIALMYTYRSRVCIVCVAFARVSPPMCVAFALSLVHTYVHDVRSFVSTFVWTVRSLVHSFVCVWHSLALCVWLCGCGIGQVSLEQWVTGPLVTGEGIYACQNGGSCVAPDVCSCADGYDGQDCSKPLCRYNSTSRTDVRGCLNGGICGAK
jgi:hypothetical protein